MDNADASIDIALPITPVRSTSESSAAALSFSDQSTVQNESSGSVMSGSTMGVPQSPQRSLQSSVAESPSSVIKSSANLSPVLMKTPAQQAQVPLQPELATSTFQPDLSTQQQFGAPEVGDLLGVQNLDFTNQGVLRRRQHYNNTPEASSQTNPNAFYASDDEETDPSSSVTPGNENQAYTRKDATSTFGKVIQPIKERMIPAKKRSSSSDDEGTMPKGAIIFGYLQKQGRNAKWQTRWFESDGDSLTYYKSCKRSQLLAFLDLAKVGSIGVNAEDSDECSFIIKISQRLYHLRADSKESCRDWVITLNRIKEARLQEGNVKFSKPLDLLDSSCPRIVLVAGRQRTHAVDDEDIHKWETSEWNENPSAEDMVRTPTTSVAKWQKSKRKLSRFASKLLRWARSIRKYGCTDVEKQVVLDHYVHPPGHDYPRKRTEGSKNVIPGENTKQSETAWLGNEGEELTGTGSSLTSNATNDSLTHVRTESLDDLRVLS